LYRGGAYLAGMLACVFAGGVVPDPERTVAPPRRVYVLHSGVHIIFSKAGRNGAAERLRHELKQRGIEERDLVVLDNPFRAATWTEPLPRDSAVMFLESANPASPTAQQAYRRLDRDLKAHGITSHDELLWIGHSAGGQMGMTMAHLAHRLPHYPDLARDTSPYRFGLVVTLGTPVAANPVPPEVPLRHYCSASDSVVSLLSKHGALLTSPLGHGMALAACSDPGPNVKVRVFQGIRHHTWCWSPQVVDAIVKETRPAMRCRNCADAPCGIALGHLLGSALDEAGRISFEE
jgi:hypothetical protein